MGGRWGPGRVIADRFELVAPIGSGGMGQVWRAEHTRLRSPVAVKLLHDSLASQPDALPRFLREAQACAAIRGPHVVQVLDFGVEEETPYIAMELLVGESLKDRLERVTSLSPRAALDVFEPIAKAIARAHKQGIVHRDMKPANVYLCRDEHAENGEHEIVKVLDFGIAKIQDPSRVASQLTTTGQVLGTMAYMSPEQVRGRMDLDHRTDLWALGIIAYQCLVGALPWTSLRPVDLAIAICNEPLPTPSQIAPSVPRAFDAWFAKATRRAPDDRFQAAAEMAGDLRDALEVGA